MSPYDTKSKVMIYLKFLITYLDLIQIVNVPDTFTGYCKYFGISFPY